MRKGIWMALAIIFVLVILGIILIGLSGARQKTSLEAPGFFGESTPSYREIPPASPTMKEQAEKAGEIAPEGAPRLVIKTGTINMIVKDIANASKNIIQYTEGKGGYVVSSTITEREKIPSGNIQVRIPAEIFDETMAYFKGLAERITYEGTKGEDVTEEYIDLQSRLRNLEAAETQLLKIMERSGTISDVLAVQKELTNVRGQIEQTKGRIQYLERSAKMATISINLALSEELLPVPPAEKWRPVYVLKQSWKSLLGFLKGISYLLIWTFVFAIIWVPLAIITWRIRRLRKKRKEVKKD